eukprot:TRINITY_DN2880_c0_g1_i1.p1 TRINITY_DN2880_c0_g1~~TRINITY_DN2880_c0_g1_i1.p1  ORF type:complete len:340 (-),score=74.72 TRINITY_DN2880_c0_g1_i1:625-1644(-)
MNSWTHLRLLQSRIRSLYHFPCYPCYYGWRDRTYSSSNVSFQRNLRTFSTVGRSPETNGSSKRRKTKESTKKTSKSIRMRKSPEAEKLNEAELERAKEKEISVMQSAITEIEIALQSAFQQLEVAKMSLRRLDQLVMETIEKGADANASQSERNVKENTKKVADANAIQSESERNFKEHTKQDVDANATQSESERNFKQFIYQLNFDGASKGNPGMSGAGIVLRQGQSVICKVGESLGTATNNTAEYRALILGLRTALEKGISHIDVEGDSILVVNQVEGTWKVKHEGLIELHKEANRLKHRFKYFRIKHVLRELNSDADSVATRAIQLPVGKVASMSS